MNFILLISILIRILAIGWSIYLLRKLRDWRIAFLTIMLLLMASRQIFTLYQDFAGWYVTMTGHLDELPGLAVSILMLIIVIAIEKIVEDQKSKDSLLQLYRDYFNEATSGIFVFNDEGKLVEINNAGCRLHGYSREEMLAMDPKEFIHPDTHHVFGLFMETLRKGEEFHGVGHGLRKDGSTFDAEIKGTLVLFDNVQYFFSSVNDITRKNMAEKALRESEEKYRSIIETTTEWIWEVNAKGLSLYSNNSIVKILGYEPDEMLNKPAFIYMHPDQVPWVKAMFLSCVEEKTGWKDVVIAWKHKDGSTRYLESNAIPFFDKNDKLLGFRGTDRDVTERREIINRLKFSEARYRALYDNNPSMFFTVDSNGIILSVNKYGAEQLGYEVAELIGLPVDKFFYHEDKDIAMEYLQNCINPDEIYRWEIRKIRRDGSIIWARETARVVYDDTGGANIFIVSEDFSDTHLLSEQLTYQASHDALTSLVNRREFEIRLNRVLETARTQKSEHALCYLDLDQFKIINDACGHIAGDELLRLVSQVLQNRVRKRDTLARLGGDEFGILMEHCTMEKAQEIASKVLQDIRDFRFEWEGQNYNIGVSIGLVPVNDTNSNKTEILREADAACYAAKEAGRNRIHSYSTDDIDLARRHGEVLWVTRINRALEKDYFVLYAQPIIKAKNHTNEIRHYEILIRLIEEDNNEVISPIAFLPATERYNMATRVDEWVIYNVLEFMRSHNTFLSNIDFFSINLSGQSLVDDTFLQFVIEKLKAHGKFAKKICFEITETAVIANMMRATLFIRKLKELGCRFSLDDFGSGMSSFAYLKTLPVDYLKIDGVFVKDIVNDETDYAMVKSINDIGQVMGIKTIAEFVENDYIKQKIIDIGVDYLQGYGIGKPKPLENILTSSGNDNKN